MFLKIATVVAILGVALSLLLALFQQVMYTAGFYGSGYLMLSRFITIAHLLMLYGGLLIFFIAFLLSLKAKTN
jgi:hypothetical protein